MKGEWQLCYFDAALEFMVVKLDATTECDAVLEGADKWEKIKKSWKQEEQGRQEKLSPSEKIIFRRLGQKQHYPNVRYIIRLPE